MTQASYDLARLSRNGLITRRPHASTYDLTPDGLALAIFYTKVHDRVLGPLFAASQPQAPPELRAALRTIERHVHWVDVPPPAVLLGNQTLVRSAGRVVAKEIIPRGSARGRTPLGRASESQSQPA